MTDPGQYQQPTSAYAGQQWQPPAAPPPKAKKPIGRWLIPVIVGVVVFIVGTSIGVAAGGGPPKVETKTVAGPESTVTATATVKSVSTVTATPPPPTATVTTTFTPQPKVAFSDGQFLVPSEVAAGTYHTEGSAGGCYYAILRDLSGAVDSIIDNNNITGPTTIQIGSGAGALQTSGGCDWTKVG